MTDFDLTSADKSSGLWQRLRRHFEDRLTELRLRNDGMLSETATAVLRGEIKCLKALIRLEEDRPMTGDDEQPPV